MDAEAYRLVPGLTPVATPSRLPSEVGLHYRFAEFRYAPHEGRLFRGDEEVPLQRRVSDALGFLVRRSGEVVSREDLLDALWPDGDVNTNAVDQLVRRVRAVLDDDPRAPRFLETVPRQGYRFACEVRRERAPRDHGPGFVGRGSELDALHEHLRGPAVVGLVGPGGVGKTRLAREFADEPHGLTVAFAALAPCRHRDDVVQAVAHALGVALAPRGAVETLGHVMAERGPLLLVLDNAEHVVGDVAWLIARWVRLAPRLRLLVTSRLPVGVHGERVVSIQPLSSDEAAALFRFRAGEDLPDAVIGPVLDAVDRLPLAIELVAARARMFGPDDLLTLIERGEGFADVRRDARHGSLAAVVAWSWGLLDAEARRALARASVFRGAFDLRAFLAVTGSGAASLEALHDGNLLQVERGASSRFRLFEVVRRFARTHLDDEAETFERHAAWFAAAEAPDALPELRAALERRPSPEVAVRCALVASHIWELEGPVSQGIEHLERVLERVPGAHDLRERLGVLLHLAGRSEEAAAEIAVAVPALRGDARARGLGEQATILAGLGRSGEALGCLAAALDEVVDPAVEGALLTRHAAICLDSGRADEVGRSATRALALLQAAGDRVGEGRALGTLGVWYLRSGQIDEGRRCYEASLAIRREVGDHLGEAVQVGNLGNIYAERGLNSEAGALFRRALGLYRKVGSRRGQAAMHVSLGVVAGQEGAVGTAREHYHRAVVVAEQIGYAKIEIIARTNLALLLLEDSAYAAALPILEGALQRASDSGYPRQQGIVRTALADCLRGLGRLDAADVHLDAGEAVLRAADDPFALCGLLRVRALVQLARGADASATVASCRELVASLGLGPEAPLAEQVEALEVVV